MPTITPSAPLTTAATAPEDGARPLARLLGLIAGLGAILVALLLVFILPSLRSGPHDLRLGIVAPGAAAVEQALDAAAPGAFEAVELGSAVALEDAIRAREVVGGIVLEADGARALVASAGSTAIASAVGAAAQALGAGADVAVIDVVPLPAADPGGIGIGGLAFPLVFGGIVPAVAFRKAFSRSLGWALAGIVGFAAVGGVLVAGVLAVVFGSIDASALWPAAGATALGIAALAVPLAGLQERFGAKGFTIGAMAMMFVGNPLAGIATTGAWLPTGLGTLGQLLPPGAAGTLVRSAAYFDGAGGALAAGTLAGWVLLGVVLLVRARARSAAAPTAAA